MRALVLLVLVLAGCPKPMPPTPVPDAGDGGQPAPVPTCAAACAHVEQAPPGLGCPTGGSCRGICERIHPTRSPAFRSCLMAARSCDDVDACDR